MSGALQTEMKLGRIAAAQQGIVTRAQLRDAGLSREAIAAHLDAGWLYRRHRGVYQLGPFGGPYGVETAAQLACGPRSVLTHWSTFVVFDVLPRPSGPVHMSVVAGVPRSRPGIKGHRALELAPVDVVVRHGLRVTTPARALLDIAPYASVAELERLIEEVQVQNLAGPAEILAVIERGKWRPGVRKLRAVAELLDEPQFTRSEAERRLLALVRSSGLPVPRLNARRAGWEVDAVWDEQRLVVEVDGYRYHRTRAKFERDRRKDADLMLAGYRVLRITWLRLVRERRAVGSLLRAALAPSGFRTRVSDMTRM